MESIRVNGASVTINLVIEDKKLAEFFEEFDGADEKATKFRELLDAALATRSAFLVDLETQTMKKSVDDAIENLEKYYAEFKLDLAKQLVSLADPEDGQFAKTFQELVENNFLRLLEPFDPTGSAPITRLRTHAENMDTQIRTYIEPIRQKLGIGGVKKDSGAGDNFESLVSTILEKQSGLLSDKATRVGALTETASTRRIGDLKIELAREPGVNAAKTIFFEMKTDKKFKRLDRKTAPNLANDEAIAEALAEMKEVTSCDAAVFVLDDEYLDMEHQVRWKVLEEGHLLIVVDRFSPSEDYIQLAYAWARWQATKTNSEAKNAFDFSDFESALQAARDELDEITNVHKILGRSMDGLTSAKEKLDLMRNSVKSQINGILSQLSRVDEE